MASAAASDLAIGRGSQSSDDLRIVHIGGKSRAGQKAPALHINMVRKAAARAAALEALFAAKSPWNGAL